MPKKLAMFVLLMKSHGKDKFILARKKAKAGQKLNRPKLLAEKRKTSVVQVLPMLQEREPIKQKELHRVGAMAPIQQMTAMFSVHLM